MKMITFHCISFFLISLVLPVYGQTNIGGVVNTYTRVLGPGACPQQLLVADPAGLEVGQRVLLISMQGGLISDTDDAGFGRIQTNTLTAGLYDWSKIDAIDGNEISLADPVSAGYDFSQPVQLVGVPHYTNVTVTQELVPLAWDGKHGGVLALEVDGRLTLAADITASFMGFRGAASVQAVDDVCTFLTVANRYFYETGNWRGAAKGEGVIPATADKALGRGPQANGGGGSNTHNSGGGGGANGSAGGLGGENREPSFGGCDGFFPGRGGLALSQWPDRWFMGGGGGAGHHNNDGNASGGNGGGIIVIKAQELEFAGGAIHADGQIGSSISGDGAGGGGAGGTIVLDVQNVLGTGVIRAEGGGGGNVNNLGANRCMGPGGGGAGGQIISTAAISPLLAGGAPGQSRNSSNCPDSPNGAESGRTGSLVSGGIRTPDGSGPEAIQIVTNSGDTTICPGNALSLSATVVAPATDNLEFQWYANAGANWMPLADNADFAGTDSPQLQVLNLSETTYFQLQVNSLCGSPVNSDTIEVLVDVLGADPVADFDYQLNGFNVDFSNTSLGAQTFAWSITEIPFYTSNAKDPSFTFPAYGTYEVILKASSDCGADSSAQTIVIGGPPIADFEGISSGSACAPFTIQWADQSQGVYEQYAWQFPGGVPATSMEPNPVVTYNTPGIFDVILVISGPLGTDTLWRSDIVKVFSVPQPQFSYQIDGLTVAFTSMAGADLAHVWSFGDGQTSSEKDPVHTFIEAGVYDVTLNLQAGGCGRSLTQTILLLPNGIRDNELADYLQVSPNPASKYLRLSGSGPLLYPLDLFLFSTNGQLAAQHHLPIEQSIDLGPLSAGIYWLLVRSRLGSGSWKVIKQ